MSSNTTPTKNSGSGYITSTVHQSPFGGVNQWGMHVATPAFTPSSYISLQIVTSTPIYTMEVNSSFGRIEKFNRRPCTISLREFKATFSIVVCELELKYNVNYIETFTFKELARYVHYETLDVYEQHFLRILGVTQIPNPTYATTITIASHIALQSAIAHHGTMPNNPNPIPVSINLSFQQLIATMANNPPTIDASTFADLVGEFFQVFELEFLIKSSEKILQFATFFQQKDETFKILYKRLLKLKEDTQSITDLEAAHQYLRSLEGTPTLHA
jgi:hypothetical protein